MKNPNFYDYIHPSKRRMILAPSACLFVALATTALVVSTGSKASLEVTIFITAYIIFCFGITIFAFFKFYLKPQKEFNQMINELKENNMLELAEKDFISSDEFLFGKVRVGKTFLFGKGNGLLIPVKELNSIRMTLTEYYGDKNFKKWTILVNTNDSNKDEPELCTLRSDRDNNFSEEDWIKLTSKLSGINPDLVVDNRIVSTREHVVHDSPP